MGGFSQQASPNSCSKRGLLSSCNDGLLTVVAFLAAEHGRQAYGLSIVAATGSVVAAHGHQSTGLIAVAHGLSWSTARGIFPDRGSNLCLLHWQADSSPLSHQGSPVAVFFFSLRSLITENSSRSSIVTRLRSQNNLGPKWLLLCQESHA